MGTAKGRELARKLNPYIGTTPAIVDTCSRICRLHPALHRIMVEWCNGDDPLRETDQDAWHAKWTAEQVRLMDLITAHVEDLPHVDGGQIIAYFNQDPRGPAVLLTTPDGLCDDTGGRGWVVPR